MRHSRHTRSAVLAMVLAAVPLAWFAAPAPAVTGTPVTDTTYAATAQVVVGDHVRGCSGVLVAPQWLLTGASCFVDDPEAGGTVAAGAPTLPTTATVGRLDLGTTTAGAVRTVTELLPRADRDVVLARLDRAVTNVTPMALATAAPAVGEELAFAGFGRTRTEWAPLNLHAGKLSVDASDATTATFTGKDGVAACAGDTGGPVVRAVNGVNQLVALTSRSYQGGCFGSDGTETRTGGVAARVDDLGSWISTAVTAARPLANQRTGRCLAVPGADLDNGVGLIQWTCSTGREQQWHLESVAGGNNDRYRVRNANSNRCLAIPGANPADTTQAIQWTCTTGTEQVWIHDSLGRLRNLATDKCLAIPGSTTTIGAKAIQWPCSTNTDQRWTW